MTRFKPKNLFWLVSTSCNERCTKCHHWARPAEQDLLDPDQLLLLIEHLDSLDEICITGGEPLLYRRAVLRVLSGAVNHGIRGVLITNGCLLDADFVNQIRDADVHVVVSIDTVDRDFWSFVRGRESYDLVLGNLRSACEAMPEGGVSVQSVLAEQTRDQLPGVRALCDELGIYHSIQDYMEEGFDGEWTALRSRETWVAPDQPCQAGGRSLSVMPDGAVYTCFQQAWIPDCERPVGLLGRDPAEVILTSDYTERVLDRMRSCHLPCRVLKCNQDSGGTA